MSSSTHFANSPHRFHGHFKRTLSLKRLGALFAFVCLPLGCNRSAKPAEEAEKTPPAPVKWEGSRQIKLKEWTELAGTTQPLPDRAARVTAPVAGRITSVLQGVDGKAISEGQLVEAGNVLVRLDATTVLANLAKAEAAKKVLEAEHENAALLVKQAEVDLKTLEDLKGKQDTPSTLVAPVMLEKARLALESAKAAVRAGERKLEAAGKDLSAFNLELKLYTLTAPRKGRLGRLQVVLGQTLAAGAPVAEIVDIEDKIDVLCFVSPAEARKLALGQKARVGGLEKNASGEANDNVEGEIVYIADQAEAETGAFAVKVRFPNSELKLRASSVVRIRVLTNPGKICWSVPESALLEDQDPPGIVIVEDVKEGKNADGKDEEKGVARRLKAITGIRDRVLHKVEIDRLEDPEKKWRGDLESALIVIEKGLSLQTGDAVKLEMEEEEEEGAAKPDEKEAAKTEEKP